VERMIGASGTAARAGSRAAATAGSAGRWWWAVAGGFEDGDGLFISIGAYKVGAPARRRCSRPSAPGRWRWETPTPKSRRMTTAPLFLFRFWRDNRSVLWPALASLACNSDRDRVHDEEGLVQKRARTCGVQGPSHGHLSPGTVCLPFRAHQTLDGWLSTRFSPLRSARPAALAACASIACFGEPGPLSIHPANAGFAGGLGTRSRAAVASGTTGYHPSFANDQLRADTHSTLGRRPPNPHLAAPYPFIFDLGARIA
jgi:hypothetical protein